MKAAAKEGFFVSDSGFDSSVATVHVSQSNTRKHQSSSLVSLEMSLARLLQASRPYCRLCSCRSSDLICASCFDANALVLNGTVQFVVMNPPDNVRQLKKSKNSAHDSLSVRDLKSTFELAADLPRPGEHRTLFCTAQRFFVWHSLYCAHKYTQNDGSSSSCTSTSRKQSMVSPALSKFVDGTSRHCNSPTRESCALATAAEFALPVKNNGLFLATEEKMERYI